MITCYHYRLRIKILLRSTGGTGMVYATTKNRRTTQAKLELKKYDRKLRKHVLFREVKA